MTVPTIRPRNQYGESDQPDQAEQHGDDIDAGAAVGEGHLVAGGHHDHEVRRGAPRPVSPGHLPVREEGGAHHHRHAHTVDVERDRVDTGRDVGDVHRRQGPSFRQLARGDPLPSVRAANGPRHCRRAFLEHLDRRLQPACMVDVHEHSRFHVHCDDHLGAGDGEHGPRSTGRQLGQVSVPAPLGHSAFREGRVVGDAELSEVVDPGIQVEIPVWQPALGA